MYKIKKSRAMIFIVMAIFRLSGFSVFADAPSVHQLEMKPLENINLNTFNLHQATQEEMEAASAENQQDRLRVVRNAVCTDRITVYPLALIDGVIWQVTDVNYRTTQTFSGSTICSLTVSKAKQDLIKNDFASMGIVLVGWWTEVNFTVDSASPISLTYTITGLAQTTEPISKGFYTADALTVVDEYQQTGISGYLTYNDAGYKTSAFNGLAFFSKN